MSTIVTIQASDAITNSRSDINTNFSNLNSDKIETSTLDTDTTLAANSDAKIATQKAVKTYVDAGGNVNASTTSKGIVEEATSAEVSARTAAGGSGARLFINPSTVSSLVPFGGDGTDGALSISSGTTTIDCANAAVVIKNYTSISITGTGALAFSNPNTNGTIIMLKSQGGITITSSATPAIDGRLMGGQAASDGYGGPSTYTAGGSSTASSATAGIAGVCGLPISGRLGKTIALALGGGGGNGAATNGGGNPKPGGAGGGAGAAAGGTAGTAGSGTTATGAGTPGVGGKGGGCIYMEGLGALNITGTIDVSGQNGTNASGSDNATGGGGGGGGMVAILYKTLTADSGTYTVTGGTAGTSTSTGVSKDGGIGKSLVAKNTEIA